MKRDILFRKYYCVKTGWQDVQTVAYHCATNALTSRYLLEPTPTLKLAPIIRKVYSGTRQNAGCWRTTQWESPWRRRMKKKPQRWLSSIVYQRCLINHHINCNNLLILAIIVMMMNRCCLLYLHSGCFYCLTIGNSLRVMFRPERILPYSSTTQGGLSYSSYLIHIIHIFHLHFLARYVTPLIINLKKANGEEISEGDVHLATGTLDTNTFEVDFVVVVVVVVLIV